MINVGQILSRPSFAQTLTVRSTTGGYNQYGEWESDTPSNTPVIGCFQKATELELSQLDFGETKQEIRKLLTQTEVNVSESDESLSDRIIWRGRRFKVVKVTDDQDYGFFRAFAVYEGQEE